jgi:hypothetical protein
MASFSKAGHVEEESSWILKCLFGLIYALSALFDELAEQLTCCRSG